MKKSNHRPLMIMAFVIAVLIKFSVHEETQVGERIVDAQVSFRYPSDREVVSYDTVDSVKVGVRGPSSDLNQLSVFTVEVVVDIPAAQLGSTPINLSASNVIFRTASDFEVVSIEPNSFTIQVEPRLVSTVPVNVRLAGEPAAGARYSQPQVRPAWIEISGPESVVRSIQQLEAPVSLDGHARTFEESVQVASPDPLIQLQPSRVLVLVPMEEPVLSFDLPQDEDAS